MIISKKTIQSELAAEEIGMRLGALTRMNTWKSCDETESKGFSFRMKGVPNLARHTPNLRVAGEIELADGKAVVKYKVYPYYAFLFVVVCLLLVAVITMREAVYGRVPNPFFLLGVLLFAVLTAMDLFSQFQQCNVGIHQSLT